MVVAAAKALVQAWLVPGCQGEILALLGVLDVKRYPGAPWLSVATQHTGWVA